jgi:hypothetical protein
MAKDLPDEKERKFENFSPSPIGAFIFIKNALGERGEKNNE